MATLTGGSGNDSLTGGTGNDALYGADGADTLSGLGGADSLFGGAGADQLFGGAGNDSLYGGDGNDTFAGGTGSEVIDGGAGTDTVDYSASASGVKAKLSSSANSGGDAQSDSITNVENLIGSAFADTLTGDNAANFIAGGGGADDISAGGGDDTLQGGAGADTLTGGTGVDFVDYSTSSAAVSVDLNAGTGSGGDAQGDVYREIEGIIGSAFDDTLTGSDRQGNAGLAFPNLIYGGGGNDSITGMAGNDTFYGGVGDDSVYGGQGADSLLGGEGSDSIFGGDGADTLYGGEGGDSLSGGAGPDLLSGGAGSDTLHVGIGDTIDGGTGDFDVLDLTGAAPYRIVYDPLNPQNGVVEFLDAQGNVLGTVTFTNIERIVACFTPGTRIATARGQRPVESLTVGDLVMTRDHGLQPLRWVGRRRLGLAALLADPSLQPIFIAQGALGQGLPLADMRVSRQHRMLIAGPRAELLFGEAEVLVRAQHLTHLPGVRAEALKAVDYVHILFDRHELVLADGAWSESFQPGDRTVSGLESGERDELFKIFPDLAGTRFARFQAARTTLKSFEAKVLLAE